MENSRDDLIRRFPVAIPLPNGGKGMLDALTPTPTPHNEHQLHRP
jgi:hypothetical protein